MKVTFKHKNGRVQVMAERYAKILRDLGRGDYEAGESQTVELAFPGTPDARTIRQVDAEIKAANACVVNDSVPPAELKASKAAKALAESAGVDIAKVIGTGEAGAITKPDVQAFIASQVQE